MAQPWAWTVLLLLSLSSNAGLGSVCSENSGDFVDMNVAGFDVTGVNGPAWNGQPALLSDLVGSLGGGLAIDATVNIDATRTFDADRRPQLLALSEACQRQLG